MTDDLTDRPRQRGALGRSPDRLRHPRDRRRAANASGTSSRRGRPSSSFPPEERAFRLRTQTNCGQPEARPRPPGWSPTWMASPSAGARSSRAPATQGLLRVFRVPVGGPSRGQDRRQHLGGDLRLRAGGVSAPGHQPRPGEGGSRLRAPSAGRGRSRPTRCSPSRRGDHLGRDAGRHPQHLSAAGMTEVNRPSPRRAVMRIDFTSPKGRSAAGRGSPASATARRSDMPRG